MDDHGIIKVAMAATNNLSGDRRVLRHAQALRDLGCEVMTIGRNEVAPKSQRGWRFYAEFNIRLARMLMRSDVDVIWANDADTLLGCLLAARRKGSALVMDAHEIFPEVPEIRHKPMVKLVWRMVEKIGMPRCDALLTVCQSLARYYSNRLGVEMTVVRNMNTSQDCCSVQREKGLLLYQGAVNVGRGVDWAIDAVGMLDDCRLMVVGAGDCLAQMQDYAAGKPWHERIEFAGWMSPDELQQLTPKAEVGLVMLEDMGLSYHYALPNRIGDFVAAGVPMVVSDLPEMASVVRLHGVGEVMTGAGAKPLVEAIVKVRQREWNDADFESARADFDWEKEKLNIEKILQNAIWHRRKQSKG